MADDNNDINEKKDSNDTNDIRDPDVDLNIDDLENNISRERRNSRRFDEKLSAMIENKKCTVLNVSNQGVLLQTSIPVYFFQLSKAIEFKLQVEGEWLRILGKVMWIQSDVLHSKIGLFIQQAPEPYFNFLKKLYE